MDWLKTIFFWWPWIDLLNDSLCFQFLFYYTTYLIFFTNNTYFTLFYVFVQFINFGLLLSILNLDIFTAFLWLAESVVIFVSILMLFYLNVYGNVNKSMYKIHSFKYYGIFMITLLISFFFLNFNTKELYIFYDLNIFLLWDDYYESLFNDRVNDLYILYLNYYIVNSFEFILIGFLLLFASVVCVNLNKFNKSNRSKNYNNFLQIFNFLNDFVKFFFIRKQNLTEQNIHTPSIKIFKKKFKKK